ncbi:MAG: prenyltransferase/squalene oxidase repeat-containing protein [Thermodesulfobacteriota bacterium]
MTKQFPINEDTVNGILRFVKARRKETGGYGATPKLPATVEDTYHALCILETLRRGRRKTALAYYEDAALKDYLSRMAEIEWITPWTTFHVLYGCRLAGMSVDEDRTTAFLKRRLKEPLDLVERYYCARILREVPKITNDITGKIANDLALARWRTAAELWMILYLVDRKRIHQMPHRAVLVSWLQACQNGDGAFGFLPGTTSYIENCHTCLRALALLGVQPIDPDGACAFIMACRTASGGFARIQGATAFLDATWHAVAGLSLLGSLSSSA